MESTTQAATKQDVIEKLDGITSKEGLEIDDVLLDYMADILLEESMHTGSITCASDLSGVIGDLVAEEEADKLNDAIYQELTASFWAALPSDNEQNVSTNTDSSLERVSAKRASETVFECLPQPVEIGRDKREARHSGGGYVVEVVDAAASDGGSDSSEDSHDDNDAADEDDDEDGPIEGCVMCERPMPITKHHLIPRKMHKYYKKKGYTFDQLQTCIMVCRDCHSAVHRIHDEKTLASSYYTLELLMECDEIQKFVAYAAKQKLKSRGDPRLNASKKRYHLTKD